MKDKILYLATGIYLKGGIERYARYQINALKTIMGNEHVLLFSLLGPKDDEAVEFDLVPDYTNHSKYKSIGLAEKIRFIYEVLKSVRRQKVDSLVINHVQLSIIGFLAKKFFKITYSTNVYGLEIWSGLKWYEKIGLLNSDQLVGDCNFILDYIEREFHISREKLHLLYDPVDLEKFRPSDKNEHLIKKYGLLSDVKLTLGTLGRLERNKGHELVIRSLPQLPEVQYLIVGGGRDADRFKQLAEELNVSERVIFTGMAPENELLDLYNLMDVTVLLSVFGKGEGEGLPLGLIEAGACGNAIICGNQDGSQDAIDINNPNGFCIDPTIEELVICVKHYLKDESMLKLHASNGLQYVRKNFDYQIFKERVGQILVNTHG